MQSTKIEVDIFTDIEDYWQLKKTETKKWIE